MTSGKNSTPAQKANALITQYISLYERKYGSSPSVNRNRDKWGFQDMIKDLGYDRACEILEYYFTTIGYGHPMTTLFRNYDRMDIAEREAAEDLINRRELRRQTGSRVKEFKERHGNIS